jgi:hypothetical protein
MDKIIDLIAENERKEGRKVEREEGKMRKEIILTYPLTYLLS